MDLSKNESNEGDADGVFKTNILAQNSSKSLDRCSTKFSQASMSPIIHRLGLEHKLTHDFSGKLDFTLVDMDDNLLKKSQMSTLSRSNVYIKISLTSFSIYPLAKEVRKYLLEHQHIKSSALLV